ncbi:hypothetical protein [Actinoplanes subtropicus]|uniref:hypothetical protein n=1 Tax=Actinoplanes subtropicus TaxID=543632 RepID=UPI0004C2DA4E|nr:hypothetical protein [Actinoplanes subtropicus]
MNSGRLWAAVTAAIALLMDGVYLWIIHEQGNSPAIWFVAGLAVAALLAGYGAMRAARGRRPVLIASGVLLLGLGLVGILTIGLPIVLAGVLAIVAATRAGHDRSTTPGPAATGQIPS